MKPSDWIEILFQHTLDSVFALLPRSMPDKAQLRNCRIVSHRGEHDNVRVFENTLSAFDQAHHHGVWGIECDVRWTKDFVPVVFHDSDLQRLFGTAMKIGQTLFHELRKDFPEIPTLSEVLDRYGGKMHLMVEIKAEVYPDPSYQRLVLSNAFEELVPERDFHFLSLDPRMFQYVDFVAAGACIPVAQINLREMSRLSLQAPLGGVAGHYLFVGRACINRHHAAGQKVGTAYIRSRNSLFREIHRGVDWLFSNHACHVQNIIHQTCHS